VVQGYKFNIFYPDLMYVSSVRDRESSELTQDDSDKSKAPTYYMKAIPDDPDTTMIVFTAGPPYEDIAFRIVRRPWEYSHRKGFRSMFDRGVLQRECVEQSLWDDTDGSCSVLQLWKVILQKVVDSKITCI
jgi:hypothetical protein